jgi:hypothetical protein
MDGVESKQEDENESVVGVGRLWDQSELDDDESLRAWRF